MQSKKEIIFKYLDIEGNNEKSVRVAINEILEQFCVNISLGMYQKTKKEWGEQSEHPVNSEQSEHPVNSEQSEHPVNSEQSEHPVNSEQSEHPVNRLDWLESLMDGVKKATNIFQMSEAIRQCDVYVQNTSESLKEDLECVYTDLAPYQKLLIDNYGLKNRLSFNK